MEHAETHSLIQFTHTHLSLLLSTARSLRHTHKLCACSAHCAYAALPHIDGPPRLPRSGRRLGDGAYAARRLAGCNTGGRILRSWSYHCVVPFDSFGAFLVAASSHPSGFMGKLSSLAESWWPSRPSRKAI